MAIVLQETLRGVFYAPFYAALALDAYGEEGVDVRLVSAPRPSESARGLADQDAPCLAARPTKTAGGSRRPAAG